ncbi:hypothetical protein [Paraburkholderia youngii]|uniref:hypothetical protein n=1 Tax=Paraburkholderia youngii TaxID=2782701 RepID=UPI001595C462|nr:hypothetical protein [Paraburkholderia youngii]
MRRSKSRDAATPINPNMTAKPIIKCVSMDVSSFSGCEVPNGGESSASGQSGDA